MSIMWATTVLRPIHAVAALWLTAGLASCLGGCMMSDAPPRARTEDSCFIGGCAAEICSDQPQVFSPCIWREEYACFRDATCARQPDGACGWTPTPELTSCLAAHQSPGEP